MQGRSLYDLFHFYRSRKTSFSSTFIVLISGPSGPSMILLIPLDFFLVQAFSVEGSSFYPHKSIVT